MNGVTLHFFINALHFVDSNCICHLLRKLEEFSYFHFILFDQLGAFEIHMKFQLSPLLVSLQPQKTCMSLQNYSFIRLIVNLLDLQS